MELLPEEALVELLLEEALVELPPEEVEPVLADVLVALVPPVPTEAPLPPPPSAGPDFSTGPHAASPSADRARTSTHGIQRRYDTSTPSPAREGTSNPWHDSDGAT